MRTPWITCAWRECRHRQGGVPYGPYDRLVVLEIVSAEFFVFGLTRCIAVNPDGTRPDLDAFRSLVGKEWSNYTRAVLEIHKALRGHQTGVREYELFETYVVPDEPLAGKPFPKVGSRHSKVQRGGERYDVHYSPEPEVALLPVSMSATDTHPLTNRPRSDGKWIKVGECRPIVPVRLSKEDAAMGLLKHMPDGRYQPCHNTSGSKSREGKARARDARASKGPYAQRPEEELSVDKVQRGLIAWVSEEPHLRRPTKAHKGDGTLFRKPPALEPPAHPWHRYPVVVTRVFRDVPPICDASDTYADVEAVLPDGPTWTVHKSQLLRFATLASRRWAARADIPSFCASLGLAVEMAALRQGNPLPHMLRRLFPTADSADAPGELCSWLCVSLAEFDEIVTQRGGGVVKAPIPRGRGTGGAAASSSSQPPEEDVEEEGSLPPVDDGYISPTGADPDAEPKPPPGGDAEYHREAAVKRRERFRMLTEYLPLLPRTHPPPVEYTTAAALRALADEARRSRKCAALVRVCQIVPTGGSRSWGNDMRPQAKRLLEDRVSPETTSPSGAPCLWLASRALNVEAVEALLEAGADPRRPHEGRSPLEVTSNEPSKVEHEHYTELRRAVVGLLEARLGASPPVAPTALPEPAAFEREI